MISRIFPAMNTDVRVVLPLASAADRQALTEQARQVFERAERTFSRFRPDSELSRLNAGNGPMVVSTELFDAIARAVMYWELTDGWFDATITRALCAAGYDRSFVPHAMDRAAGVRSVTGSATSGDVRLDRRNQIVELPCNATIDCGGFIKGWTVDRVAQMLPSPAAVDAGGDAALRGTWPGTAGWPVHVEDPWRPGRPLHSLTLQDRAVATSGTSRRHWRVGAREAHHLIDPHTGQPAESDLVQVTVTAPSVELADVLAKTVFLRGQRDGERFLKRFDDVTAVLVMRDGRTRIYGEVMK